MQVWLSVCLSILPSLQELDVGGTKGSDAGVRELQAALPKLQIKR